MSTPKKLHELARLPSPEDNCAIAVRNLQAGTRLEFEGQTLTLDFTVLEGHRFAVRPVSQGQALLSWGYPFGSTLRDLAPGSYVCNASMLETLKLRRPELELPPAPNFRDEIRPYLLDESHFRPGRQVAHHDRTRTFLGFRRDPRRGIGTRNYIVILGTTSQTGGFVRQLASRFQGRLDGYPHLDGVVAVAHTEGGGGELPNNLAILLRALAGFILHPNVGAVLIVDRGAERVTNPMLLRYMQEQGHPLDAVRHHFLTLTTGFQQSLKAGVDVVSRWLKEVSRVERTEAPVSALRIALQCGGSDAFSGISGNPLAAWVTREIIRYGGAANLAETDELIGAEASVLQNVRDLETARRFLELVERFKERVAWHGETAEGNPSGGNRLRGLYNIALKSLGAAAKRHPEVRLDEVIEYGEPMVQPGFYFMDSPGNDLESVAGQVASGANLIFFTTGNGSITNFPFVPTVKIVTTTRRFELLSEEMDVNAGAYLDGVPMEELGRRMLELTIEVASGRRTQGEKAGHSQVSIWRDWRQTDSSNLQELLEAPETSGRPLPVPVLSGARLPLFDAFRTERGFASEQIALIVPTSICSGQVARLIAEHLNGTGMAAGRISRFVALPHTEGCGVASRLSERLYTRTVIGYLRHPFVRAALLLEHGCEKTHNDHFRRELKLRRLSSEAFGWASIQLDGGIERVTRKVEEWFASALSSQGEPAIEPAGLEHLRVGLLSFGPLPADAARALGRLARRVVSSRGTVLVPEKLGPIASAEFREEVLGQTRPDVEPTLAYGQRPEIAGLHLMETPTEHWVETLTGLGATGVELMLGYTGLHPQPAHPMIPLLQVTADAAVAESYGEDLDLVLSGRSDSWPEQLFDLIAATASRRLVPRLFLQGNIDFQLTRGLLGVST